MTENKKGPTADTGRAKDQNADDAVIVFFDKDGNIRSENMVAADANKPVTAKIDTAPPAPAKSAKPVETVESASGASAEDYAEDIADLIEQKFMGLLKQRLAKSGGHLSEDDVAEMGAEFRTQLTEIRTIFLDAVKNYAKASHRSLSDELRENAFQRLMVHRFEARLAPDSALDKSPDRLTRRMLPGFFSALSLMIGQDNLKKFNHEAEILAKGLKSELGDAFDWTEVYNSKTGRRITLHAEILMAQNFRDVEKRIDWLIAFINGNLITIDRSLPGADWAFSESAARSLLSDLFSGTRNALSNDVRRDALARSLSPKAIDQLEALIKSIG